MRVLRSQSFKVQEKYRVETLDGKEYYAVPVIAMIEGVRFGAAQDYPELGLAANFGKYPTAWNTSPVVMNHPEIDGSFVSAKDKNLLETHSFGQILNTELKGNKLHMEAWLDTSKRDLSGDVARVFERLENDEIVEVSVGFFCDVEDSDVTREFNGQEYQGIWTNIVPDHLAILDETQIGACSVADGCGTRTQTLKVDNMAKENNKCCSCEEKSSEQRLLAKLCSQATPEGMYNEDARNIVSKALEDTEGYWSYIIVMTNDEVVYYSDKSDEIYRRTYNIAEDFAVTFTGDPEKVVISTKVITLNSQGKVMSENEAPAEATEIPATPAEAIETPATPVEVTKTPVEDEEVVEPTTQAAQTVDAYINAAPDAIKEVLIEGIRAHEAKKYDLISTIKVNKANKFTDTYLKAQSIAVLENLAQLASASQPRNFSGQAPAGNPIVNNSDDDFIPAPKVFEYKKKQ